jgi:hypothetical protein
VTSQLSFPDRVMLPVVRAKADAGIERVADATERRIEGWCEMACEKLREFARGQSGHFTCELARCAFQSSIPAPHDLRAWGKVSRMAMQRGYIEKVPGQFFAAASSNGSPKPVYRRGPNAGVPLLTESPHCVGVAFSLNDPRARKGAA